MVYIAELDMTLITTKDNTVVGIYSGKPNETCENEFVGKFYVAGGSIGFVQKCRYCHRYVQEIDTTIVFAVLAQSDNYVILHRILGTYKNKPNNEKTNNIIQNYYMEA